MREKGSKQKGGVDQIQWWWTRSMEGVHCVQGGGLGEDIRHGKRREEADQQRKDIVLNNSTRTRFILPTSDLTAEWFRERLMIGRTRRLFAMIGDGRLTQY